MKTRATDDCVCGENLSKEALDDYLGQQCDHIRTAFCRTAATCSFHIRSIVVDKNRITDPRLRKFADEFYQFVVTQLLTNSLAVIESAKVCIDGSMDRNLKTHIQRELNREMHLVHSIKFYDSRRNSIIQLADMVVGSIARSFKREKQDCDTYRKLLAPRIEEIWELHPTDDSVSGELVK